MKGREGENGVDERWGFGEGSVEGVLESGRVVVGDLLHRSA